MAVKSIVRDNLGRFAKATSGRRARKGLGKRQGRGGRDTNSVSGGGKIGGVDSSKAARKAQSSSEDKIVEGKKLKR